jgi:hypothetical protein
MRRPSRSDRALLLNAARRDLRHAPKVLGYGRADLLRSAPFRARYRGVCPRCRKRIDVGVDIRYHIDFADPVHVGCREPSASTEPGPTKPKPTPRKEKPVCPGCWTQHARTVLVAHDNRCFRAFWCVHFDQQAFSRSPLLSTQMVVLSATVVTQTATGRGQGCACSAAQRLRLWMLPGGRKGPASSSAVPPCPLASSERNWERRDG